MTSIPPYDLQRSNNNLEDHLNPPSIAGSMDYSEPVDEHSTFADDSYVAASSLTAGPYPYPDATQTVHEMHLALLYLLSNPEEFKKALQESPPRGATTLAEWNQEYENETVISSAAPAQETTPLPFVVFADDAEVVLPQAHTASQLFGVERVEGIELEAAAGVPALSQLFLRWLALMPGGDHLNIIDPPGLTVMRIAGGRYRVTAAHRVVWTWMNEFISLEDDENKLQIGDLVTITVVDVFETDNNGKLLSYCPTFDNRDIRKTTQASETIRKSSSKIMTQFSVLANSSAAARVNQGVSSLTQMGIKAARSVASQVKQKMEGQKAAQQEKRQQQQQEQKSAAVDAKEFEQALNEAEKATTGADQTMDRGATANNDDDDDDAAAATTSAVNVNESYISDDSTPTAT